MSRDGRLSYMWFYPKDFITDPVVVAMNLEERGAYITLLCHLALMPEPGVVENNDAVLSRLSGAGTRWPEVRAGVVAAFKLDTKGRLVQRRMVHEHRAAVAAFEAKKRSGRVAAKARWDKPIHAAALRTHYGRNTKEKEREKEKKTLPPQQQLLTAGEGSLQAPFRPGLVSELEARFPNCDVRLVATKLLEYHREKPYKSINRALINWVAQAEKQGTERRAKPFNPESWAKESDS